MAKNNYQLVCDFSRSFFMDTATNQVPVIAGKESKVPDQVVGDSFALNLLVYDDYDATVYHDFGSSATAKLYIKRRNSDEDGVEIATGTISQSNAAEYDTVEFSVNSGAITSVFGNLDCLLYAVITSTNEQRTAVQYLSIFSVSGDGTATPAAAEISNTVYSVTAKTTAPGASDDSSAGYAVGDYIWHSTGSQLYRADAVTAGAAVWTSVSTVDSHIGTAYYLCDTTAADVTVALPSGNDGEIKHIKNDSGSNQVTITGTIKNTTDIVLDAADDCMLIWDGSTWINLNFDTIIR